MGTRGSVSGKRSRPLIEGAKVIAKFERIAESDHSATDMELADKERAESAAAGARDVLEVVLYEFFREISAEKFYNTTALDEYCVALVETTIPSLMIMARAELGYPEEDRSDG